MPFTKNLVGVDAGKMFYRPDEKSEWKCLKTPGGSGDDPEWNIRDITFSSQGITISQFDRKPRQVHEKLTKDTLSWTINFASVQKTQFSAREYMNE